MTHAEPATAALQVGVALDFAPRGRGTYADRLRELEPLVDAVDRLGLRSISAGESYPERRNDPMGFHAPNALMMLSTIASRTSVTQLIAGVVLLSAWPTERLVHDVGLTDQLCDGRLTLGLGLGPMNLWEQRGVTRSDVAPAVDAAIAAIRERLADDMSPGPVNRSMPIWIGGALQRSVKRAAELGDGYTVSTGYHSTVVTQRSSEYWALRGALPGAVSINRVCVVAASSAVAHRRADAGATPLLRAYARAGAISGADASTADADLLAGTALVGSPDDLAHRVNAFIAAGVTHLQLRVAPGLTEIGEAIETLDLFVNEVVPQLADRPRRTASTPGGPE